MPNIDSILSDMATLSEREKLQLVDKILLSVQPINKGVDAAWSHEAEERVKAFDAENISIVEAQDVLEKYGD
ncbi:MAG: addiction module protein [Sulfurovum sp.]|nr:addiction module protein [Sulfurovum sp.]